MDQAARTGTIDREEVRSLLCALVRIPSINPFFRREDRPADWFGEARLATFIADWLAAEGIEVRLEEVLPGRPNVVARLPGPPGAPRLVWEGHMDTVQVEGMEAPFSPRVEGSRLYGRGAVDDKGCLAMFMLALRALKRRGTAAEVTFVAAIDEETTFEGVLHHVRTHPPYDLGIAGEPTRLAIVTACKGVIRFTIEIRGRSAHASQPEEGIDAARVAADLVTHLDAYMRATDLRHPVLGRRTLTCTLMQAGEGVNTVPGHARLTFDLRTLPAQTGDEAWEEVAGVVKAFADGHPAGAAIEIRRPFIDSVSMEVPEDAAVVTALSAALRASGHTPEIVGVAFGSDATKMTRTGTPTVVFGPGRIEEAHADHEHVDMDEVAAAAEVLVRLARGL
ncbi:M20 family metallopeptidase [Ensifer soli]|uniref:M20 family metallopeptidase n=1 Tax=Ciceribacter sp. sgz301302 TaxID=3342379 RepID=UPI0035B8C4E4